MPAGLSGNSFFIPRRQNIFLSERTTCLGFRVLGLFCNALDLSYKMLCLIVLSGHTKLQMKYGSSGNYSFGGV